MKNFIKNKNKFKPSIEIFNLEYFFSITIRCIILVSLINVLFSEFAITKTNIIPIALLEVLAFIYGLSFVFIKPLIKSCNRYDLSTLDSEHLKTSFFKTFKLFYIIYLSITTIPHWVRILECFFSGSGFQTNPLFYFNEILISVFYIVNNFIWIKIAHLFLKSNFDLMKNKYTKFIYTHGILLLIILFALSSIATTYFKSFKTIVSNTESNSTSTIEEPEENEFIFIKYGLKKPETTLIYSRNEIYTADTSANRIICYEDENFEKAKIVFELDDTAEIHFKDADFIYKQDNCLYLCYPSKEINNFTKAGFYSFNLETKEYKLIIDDILNYNFSGKKLSDTFDCVTHFSNDLYNLLSYDYINDHIKNIQSFEFESLSNYVVKKSNDNLFLQLNYRNGISEYFINGENVFYLKQSFINNTKWFALNNYLYIFDSEKIYKIDSQSPFTVTEKLTDLSIENITNRFFFDPAFTDLNPPISEKFKYIFSLDYQSLENTLLQAYIVNYSPIVLTFDETKTEIYAYDDSTVLVYNKTHNNISYADKKTFKHKKVYTSDDSYFIEFDIENIPYIIQKQQIKPFALNN